MTKEIEEDEESELEEELERDELEELVEDIEEDSEEGIIDEEDLSEFLHFSSRRGPVLENIAVGSQEFGGRIVATPQMLGGSGEREELGELYGGTKQNSEDPKYVNSSSVARNDVSSIDMTNVGRDVTTTRVGEIGFRSSVESANSPVQEKYSAMERIDVGKAGRENPFSSHIKPLEKKKGEDYYVVK